MSDFDLIPTRGYTRVFPSWFNILRDAGQSLKATTADQRANYLLNSEFRFWQEGTTRAIPNGTEYAQDFGAIFNGMSGGGILTASRIAGVNSQYAGQYQVSTAGSSGSFTKYILISNEVTNVLLDKIVSISGKIKALGNVDNVTINLQYNTTASLLSGSWVSVPGAFASFAVNTSTFTDLSSLAIDVNSLPTQSGLLRVAFAISTVSTGNIYDLNNGFILEQPQLVVGGAIPEYIPSIKDPGVELSELERFYQKSYPVDTSPGTGIAISSGEYHPTNNNGVGGNVTGTVRFRTKMRSTPTVNFYSSENGNLGQVSGSSGGDQTPGGTGLVINETDSSYIFDMNIVSPAERAGWHWVADARY